MKRTRIRSGLAVAVMVAVALAAGLVRAGAGGPEAELLRDAATPSGLESSRDRVGAAMLIYGKGSTGMCFSDGFLTILARQTGLPLNRRFTPVRLDSPTLFEQPFAVLSGQGGFTLSEAERANLGAYLRGGGVLLASAGCSNAAWASSFEAELRRAAPGLEWSPIGPGHPLMDTVFELPPLSGREPTAERALVWELRLGGRWVGVYSPLGLNDTANAGGGCCCCGGNELRDAHLFNANALAYALTR